VTVIDGEAPDSDGLLGSEYTATEVFVKLVDVIELAVEQPLGIDADDLAPLNDHGRLRLLHQALVRVGKMPARSSPGVLAGTIRTFGAALRTTYRPDRPYPDPIRLVTVSDPRKDANADQRRCEEQLRGWQQWAPSLSCWHAPGNHMTVLEAPHVALVADWWRSGPQSVETAANQ
jgi:thioesterase domain-containing protein